MSKRSVFRPRSFDNETWIVVRYDDTDGLSELFRAGEIQTVDGESLAGTGREHLFSVGDPCLAPWKKQGHFPAVVAVISDDKTECLKEKERVIKSDKTKKDATGRKKYGDRKKKPNKADSGSIMENTKPTGKSVPKAPKENEASSVKRKKQDSGSAKENKKPTGKSVPKAPEENETSSVKRKKQELQKEAKRAKEAQTAAAQDIAASLFIACLEKKHGYQSCMLPSQEQPWVTSTPNQSNLHENSASSRSFLQSLSEPLSESRHESSTDLLNVDDNEVDLEIDVENSSPPPSSYPPTTNFNLSGMSCIDCQLKDKEIQDLKNELNDLRRNMSSRAISAMETRERSYRPKTRPDVPLSDYIEIKDASNIQEGYQLLAPGAPIAVRSLWLHQVMASIGRYRDRKEKGPLKRTGQ